MNGGFIVFDWLDGVPANVIANLIAVALGVIASRVAGKVANGRIWSLDDPSRLVVFVAQDSREAVQKGAGSYWRPATGVGQVRAMAKIAPSLRTAYRTIDLGKVVISGSGVGADLRSDLIALGGAKNNVATGEIMRALLTQYALPPPSPGEAISWMDRAGKTTSYEAEIARGPYASAAEDQIQRDYGVIVKAPNPWNPRATVIVIRGASTHGTEAAAAWFVAKRRWRRPKHFTALVDANVSGGYVGDPVLRDLRRLERPAPRP